MTVSLPETNHGSFYAPMYQRRAHHSLIRNPLDLIGLNPHSSDPNEDKNFSSLRRGIGTAGRWGVEYLANAIHPVSAATGAAAGAAVAGTGFWSKVLHASNNYRIGQVVLDGASVSKWAKWGLAIEHLGGIAKWMALGTGGIGAILNVAVLGLALFKGVRDASKVYDESLANNETSSQRTWKSVGKFVSSMAGFFVGYQVGAIPAALGIRYLPTAFKMNWIGGLAAAGFVGSHAQGFVSAKIDSLFGIPKPGEKNGFTAPPMPQPQAKQAAPEKPPQPDVFIEDFHERLRKYRQIPDNHAFVLSGVGQPPETEPVYG